MVDAPIKQKYGEKQIQFSLIMGLFLVHMI
jgi:hypothetical protein